MIPYRQPIYTAGKGYIINFKIRISVIFQDRVKGAIIKTSFLYNLTNRIPRIARSLVNTRERANIVDDVWLPFHEILLLPVTLKNL